MHIATASAFLRRMNGIPARYVTGFLVNIPRESASVLVPGYASHACIEMWTNESGWTIQEATPPMLPDFLDDPFYYDLYNPFDSNHTGRQLEIIMGDRIPSRSLNPEERRRFAWVPFGVTVITTSIICMMVWFFLCSSRAPATRRRKMKIATERMIAQSIKVGAADPAALGWSVWGRSIDRIETGAVVHDAVEMIHRVYLGGATIPADELRTIRRITKFL